MKIKVMLLFCAFVAVASASQKEQVDVISVEYPPYTSKHMEGFGDVTQLLSAYARENFVVDIKPRFLPTARADKVIQDGQWCLSTYPPKQQNQDATFVSLSSETVILTLIRVRKDEVFKWSDLSEFEGAYVAVLRTKKQTALQKQMIDAGLRVVHIGQVEQGLLMLLKQRVDFVLGDQKTIMETEVGQKNKKQLQISETPLLEAGVGFYYNKECQNRLFGTPDS